MMVKFAAAMGIGEDDGCDGDYGSDDGDDY
jgi:hypothetical protein